MELGIWLSCMVLSYMVMEFMIKSWGVRRRLVKLHISNCVIITSLFALVKYIEYPDLKIPLTLMIAYGAVYFLLNYSELYRSYELAKNESL